MTDKARAASQMGKAREGNGQKSLGKVWHRLAAHIWLSARQPAAN